MRESDFYFLISILIKYFNSEVVSFENIKIDRMRKCYVFNITMNGLTGFKWKTF